MATARTRHAAITMSSGSLLVSGGRPGTTGALSSGEVYDPVANAWTAVSNGMANARHEHTHSLLAMVGCW